MIAIRTRYHGATDTRGARISATDGRHRVTISYPHELSGGQVHAAAVKALCEKLGWTGELIGGQLYNRDYYWTFATDRNSDRVTV